MTWERNTQAVMNYLVLRAKDNVVLDCPFPQIAKGAGVGLRSVPRHIEALEKNGSIKVNHTRGRGVCNVYEII